MPPWNANPKYGHFKNERRLSDSEKQLIRDWVANGAPEGTSSASAPAATFEPGWRMGKPDMVVSIPKPYAVPASGDVPYEFIAANPGFTEDRWVKAAEIRPGCRGVVHHVLVFVQPPGGGADKNGDFASNWLVAYVPGCSPMILPEGTAKHIPAGSRLLFQIHYTPNGAPATDQTSVGLIFAKPAEVKHEITVDMAANTKFAIPAGAANYKIESSSKMRQDELIYRLMPHTHLRGKSFQIAALYPDGKREILLDVPRYDFNWQYTYDLAEPRLLPKGSKIICTAYYDNSKANRSNPNPNATVRWGDQTWEEMQIGYFDHVPVHEQGPKMAATTSPGKAVKLEPALEKAARQALTSDASFNAFAQAVRRALPQVDRVCLSTYFGGKLNVEHVANFNPKAEHLLPEGFEGRSEMYGLRRYALYGGDFSNPDLSKKRGVDLKHMASAFASSFHAAIAVEGRPGSVNFWSQKPGAFSEDERALLRALTQVTGMP
jgi:hypothetical protein